jgi:hypothetical protein
VSKKNSKKKHSARPSSGTAAPTLVEASSTPDLRLDLGCGQNPKDGFEGVDLYGDKAKHKVNLFQFPFPFADSSVTEINCSHFMEHIPAREVEERDIAAHGTTWSTLNPDGGPVMRARREQFVGQDMLFAFVDECYRILKPDGWITIVVPSARSNRGFQDPTHRRFFVQETFCYFARPWREANGLGHYRVRCNLVGDIGWSLPSEESLKSQESQQMRFMHYWNVMADWIVKLRKMP